ncbi:ABC transporter ATP-binding protein [Clostridium sp. CM028]|uniref:ATP-binding cassette domain-containing protein n=1 Tax=unclassified Clostridium TaxID=2614128 RepID=UPI001C6F03D0|nr:MULTISPECIES: ABC transporter ATP-binding protein [unclassified Clostridium]MBW9146862.1 ABC transporter ATP-binding protein [Clostridium sp. CM027]MBW9150238.1 ABC transporter ATP-binding protein [Clostridium sp. CM028]UVE42841.1 ABC transporter ATP-binding protein [Clostridium sp. CM027]WLC63468.1 ABC transporter ATP-binding protein [Clostridium sp. CM028]
MVTIKNLEVRYGKQIALSIKSPITFEIGDRIGIIGSNGAGKSTLVKSILGLTNYNGTIHTSLKPEEMSAHMQENNYVDTMAIKHIIEAILNTKIKSNKVLQELISFFNFEQCLNKKFSTLSGGQKQRLTIILVLIQDAPLVFFDEVTSGLDFETRQQLMSKITEWYENKSATICIVSHYYEELDKLANKILILDKGQVVDFGSKEDLFQKYCGKSTITIENNKRNEELTRRFTKIVSPKHLIAISCKCENKELEIVKVLIDENINFKRSNNDIEIMSINAKARFGNELEGEASDEYKAV